MEGKKKVRFLSTTMAKPAETVQDPATKNEAKESERRKEETRPNTVEVKSVTQPPTTKGSSNNRCAQTAKALNLSAAHRHTLSIDKPQIKTNKHTMTLTEESLARITDGSTPQSIRNVNVLRNPVKGGEKKVRTSVVAKPASQKLTLTANINRPGTASKKYDQIKSELRCILKNLTTCIAILTAHEENSRAYTKQRKIVGAATSSRKSKKRSEITEIAEETVADGLSSSRPATVRLSATRSKKYLISCIEIELRISKHKGAFDMACTSTKPPSEIMREVVKALERHKLKYKKVTGEVARIGQCVFDKLSEAKC